MHTQSHKIIPVSLRQEVTRIKKFKKETTEHDKKVHRKIITIVITKKFVEKCFVCRKKREEKSNHFL